MAIKNSVLVASLLALSLAIGYLLRDTLRAFVYGQLTRNMFVALDNDAFDPGPALGSSFPGVQAVLAGKAITLLAPFAEAQGTLLIVNRSLATSPYSRRQMVQLQANKAAFDAAGIGMVAITPDTPAEQRAFVTEYQITIPLLSDIDALSVKTLGLLDEHFLPADAGYGNPHPGMIVIDPHGIVVAKLFLEDNRTRVDSAATLAIAKSALGIAR